MFTNLSNYNLVISKKNKLYFQELFQGTDPILLRGTEAYEHFKNTIGYTLYGYKLDRDKSPGDFKDYFKYKNLPTDFTYNSLTCEKEGNNFYIHKKVTKYKYKYDTTWNLDQNFKCQLVTRFGFENKLYKFVKLVPYLPQPLSGKYNINDANAYVSIYNYKYGSDFDNEDNFGKENYKTHNGAFETKKDSESGLIFTKQSFIQNEKIPIYSVKGTFEIDFFCNFGKNGENLEQYDGTDIGFKIILSEN